MKFLITGLSILLLIAVAVFVFRGSNNSLSSSYEYDYIDTRENMSIYYNDPKWGAIGVVGPTVFAIGYNDSFIIVKQHPHDDFRIQKEITNYFIIPLKFKLRSSPDDNKIGPLTER